MLDQDLPDPAELERLLKTGDIASLLPDHGVGSPVHECPYVKALCEALWKKAQELTEPVTEIRDAVERTEKMAAEYAQTFLDNPEQYWAGAAAFKTKQAACAMRALDDNVVKPALENRTVRTFKETYQATRFALDNVADVPNKPSPCSGEKPPTGTPPGVQQGLEQLAQGKPEEAAMSLLRNEHIENLKDEVMDKALLDSLGSGATDWIKPTAVAMVKECTSALPEHLVPPIPGSDELSEFADQFPHGQDVLNKVMDMANGEGRDFLMEQLRGIADKAGVNPGL